MFEISLFDILTFAAASAAALTAWHASQGYESTTRRFEKTLERGIAKTGGRASNDAATHKRLDSMEEQSSQIARDVKGLVDANANAQIETASLAQNVAGLSELARESSEEAQRRHNEMGERIEAATAAIRDELTTLIGAKAARALADRVTATITAALAGKSGEKIAKAVAAAAKKELRKEKPPTPVKPKPPTRRPRKTADAREAADDQAKTPDATAAESGDTGATTAAEPPEGSESGAPEDGKLPDAETKPAPPAPEGETAEAQTGKPAEVAGGDTTAAE